MPVYYEKDDLKIIHDKCDEDKSIINANSVDLCVTSPPYAVGIEYENCEDAVKYDDYLNFSAHWLFNCFYWLKAGGRLALNCPFETCKFGKQSVYADLLNIAKKQGFHHYTTAIWTKGNVPRVSWGTMYSPKAPLLIPPAEAVIILHKGEWSRKDAEGKTTDVSKKEFIDWCDVVWKISPESAKKLKHPAPYPIELARRCIKLMTFVGDVVLDPFLGSGSTMVAAYRTNRKCVGIEMSEVYCELSKNRLIDEMKIQSGRIF